MAQPHRVSPRRAGRDKPHPWTMVGLRAKQRHSFGRPVAARPAIACAIGGHSHRRLPGSPPANPRILIMPRSRCAILDDYQNVALKAADWSKVSGDLDIKVFNAHLGGDDKVIAALQGFDIVCAMRERTAFPRAVIEKLPALKLLITTGLRNPPLDVAAANEPRAVVCGTPAVGSPTPALAIRLLLELTRRLR